MDPASAGFSPIELTGLVMNVQSHPTGIYGTSTFISKLDKALNLYFENPADIDHLSELESQGATLPWGGLFDINRDWLNPHCGHRDGKTIDISINTPLIKLDPLERNALESAISEAGLNFYYAPESPEAKTVPTHWHIQE